MPEQTSQILPMSLDFTINVDAGLSLKIDSASLYFGSPGVEITLNAEDHDGEDDEIETALVGLASLTAAVNELNRLWESYYPKKDPDPLEM